MANYAISVVGIKEEFRKTNIKNILHVFQNEESYEECLGNAIEDFKNEYPEYSILFFTKLEF